MKRMLIPALEELNDEEFEEIEEVEVPEDLDAAMLAVMEADEDVEEQFEEMDKTDETADEVESAVERLEVLASVIRQHGISAGMMKAADPYRELVEAGICKSYEELGDESVKDEESEAIAEAIETIVESSESILVATIDMKFDEIEASLESKIADAANAGASVYGGVSTVKQAKLSRLKESVKAAKSGIGSQVGKAGAAIKAGAGKAGAAAKTAGKAIGGQAGKAGAATKAGYAATKALAVANPVTAAVIAATAVALATIAGVALAKSMATHKGALKSAQAKLASITSFDDAKFKGMTKKVLSKDEFGKAIKGADLITKTAASGNLVKLADDIESLISSGSVSIEKVDAIAKKAADSLKAINTEDIKSIFGLEVITGEKGIQAIKAGASVTKSKGNLGEKGWAPGDAKAAVEACGRITAEGEALVKSVKTSASVINKVASSLKKGLKNDEVDKAAVKAAVGQIKNIVSAYKMIVKASVSAIYKVNGTATQVAKAAIGSAE